MGQPVYCSPECRPEDEAGLEHADVDGSRRLGDALVEQRRAERRQRRRADPVQDLRGDKHVLKHQFHIGDSRNL